MQRNVTKYSLRWWLKYSLFFHSFSTPTMQVTSRASRAATSSWTWRRSRARSGRRSPRSRSGSSRTSSTTTTTWPDCGDTRSPSRSTSPKDRSVISYSTLFSFYHPSAKPCNSLLRMKARSYLIMMVKTILGYMWIMFINSNRERILSNESTKLCYNWYNVFLRNSLVRSRKYIYKDAVNFADKENMKRFRLYEFIKLATRMEHNLTTRNTV